MKPHVLMIDDDTRLAEMVGEYLASHGFELSSYADGASGLAALERGPSADIGPGRAPAGDFAAVLLDVMLPDTDGFELCRRIRARSDVPVLMLTARGEDVDRIVGLELGADDYLPKPFNPRELLARLRAVLRRSAPAASAADARGGLLRFGRLQIDREARQVWLDGRRRELTSHQFSILQTLAEHAGRVLSREQLIEQVRGEPLEAFDRSIDVHISRIRAAIEDDPKAPRRILTVRGVGYVFARAQDPSEFPTEPSH